MPPEPLDRSARNCVCRSPVAVARSSSGGVAIRYVLPVLLMTSRNGCDAERWIARHSTTAINDVAIPRGGSDVYECLVY